MGNAVDMEVGATEKTYTKPVGGEIMSLVIFLAFFDGADGGDETVFTLLLGVIPSCPGSAVLFGNC